MSQSIQFTVSRDNDFEVSTIRHMVGKILKCPQVHATATDVSGGNVVVDSTSSAYGKSNSLEPTLDLDFPTFPIKKQCKATFHTLQEWEGYVVNIRDEEFVARLVDLTAGHTHESKEAVIPLANVSDYDASRMVVGSIFRWVIGYERSVEGTKRCVSQIVFRYLPKITEDDLQKGQEWMRSVVSVFNR